jgi:hypothetical protein
VKPKVKPVFSKDVTKTMIEQMLEAYQAYKKLSNEHRRRGDDPDDVPIPEYTITGIFREKMKNFLMAAREVQQIGEDLEKTWGKDALEVSDMLIEEARNVMVQENGRALGMCFVTYPEEYEVQTEGDEDA